MATHRVRMQVEIEIDVDGVPGRFHDPYDWTTYVQRDMLVGVEHYHPRVVVKSADLVTRIDYTKDWTPNNTMVDLPMRFIDEPPKK